jgi:hypothetical protein
MSVTITPSIQILSNDPSTNPEQNIAAQTGNFGILCPNSGAEMQNVTLPAATAALALPFPIGVTTGLVVYVAALTATDLIVKVGASNPVSLQIPQGQGLVLYNVASNAITLNSVLGGKIQFAVGG